MRRGRGRLRLIRTSRRGASASTSQRALLLAPRNSYRISAYCEAARSLGVRLLVVSDGAHSLVPEVSGGLHVDLDSPDRALERILHSVADDPVDAVVATDDATGELASRVASELGLPHNPTSAARVARRKDLARAALRRAGVPSPWFARVDLEEDLPSQLSGVPFPCVVKPLALAASRGVIRADDLSDLVAACRRVARIVADRADESERRHLLVEAFVPGSEVAVEGMLSGGELEVLAIFDKPDPLDGPYFEETYYVMPSRLAPSVQALLERRVGQACHAYGLRHGPVHAELRVTGDDAIVLEVAARTIGGDCARLLTFGSGRSLEELVLGHALGWPLERGRMAGAAGVLMLPIPGPGTLRRIEGVLEARKVPGVEDVVIAVREGYELVPLPEGGSYLGFVFARAASPAEVEAALRRAHACLEVVVAPAWPLVPGIGRQGTHRMTPQQA